MSRSPKLRMVFDEQMSVGVARALRELGKPVTHVGAKGQLPKRSSDHAVADFARTERRAVFTTNYDMVLAACDLGARFVWFDKRGREAIRLEQALICLGRWDDWERLMADPDVMCLKVGRQSVSVLSVDDARLRARRRYLQSQRPKKASRQRRASSAQGLLFEDDE